MVIAINTKYFLKAYQQDYSSFVYECFSRIAKQQPHHTFIFFSDAPFDHSFKFLENSIPVIVAAKFKASVLSGFFYKIEIVSLLKKYKASVFFNADGFCSPFTKVPHCFIVYHPDCLSNKDFIRKNNLFLYKKFTHLFFKRVRVIVTESQFSKKYILQHYKVDEQKIDIVYPGPIQKFGPIEWEEKEKVKAQYSSGNEYFIFNGGTSRQNVLLNLLKAFSQFKKWQKSSMQLLIVKKDTLHKSFTESLRLFKYREDVKVLNNLPGNELTKAIAAAYCTIYSPSCEDFELPPLQAMQCGIPLITSNARSISETCSDAVLYVEFDNPADLAEKLMLIFKDEKLRQELIEKGKQTVQKYSWERTSEFLWQSILKSNR